MPTFFVTFGQKWRYEKHPQGMHPDGWLEIVAETKREAEGAATDFCLGQWADIYDEEDFDAIFYPRGQLRKIICPL